MRCDIMGRWDAAVSLWLVGVPLTICPPLSLVSPFTSKEVPSDSVTNVSKWRFLVQDIVNTIMVHEKAMRVKLFQEEYEIYLAMVQSQPIDLSAMD